MTDDSRHREAETFDFQAESRQLLDIVIHSLYSDKEIFLRELISNASDALDRLRFEALTDSSLLGDEEELRIRLEVDEAARTLTIRDNGVGMSREEVMENIGTIAKSGTRELMKQIRENPNPAATAELIGQFGVGFYSSFMVADRVTLVSRRAGQEGATRWESRGDGTYTLEDTECEERGTTIILHLKPEDQENGLEDFTRFQVLQDIVKRHSDFVAYPILADHRSEQPLKDKDGEIIEGKTETVTEEKTLNSREPIWMRPASEVSEEDYAEFYRHISHDWNAPLDTLSLRAEGRIEYRALLFLPEKAPFDLYYRDQQWGLRLYVRRVMIMEHCQKLLPPYLRFVRGIVDSSDLPLNISREMVQQDRHITQMSKWLTRKILDHLAQLRNEDEEKFLKLWAEVGRVLKEGAASDADNQSKILPLLYFQSSNDQGKLTTLDAYVERMKDGQEEIFFLTGESRTAIESSPHLEAFRARAYEVLYLMDPVDEIFAGSVFEYRDKRLKSIGKGKVELGTEEERKEAEKELDEKKKTYGSLMERLQTSLDEYVKEVRLSTRLTTSPVCLVAGEFDLSPQLERMLRQSEGAANLPSQKRIMELNPNHELLVGLQTRFEANADDPVLDEYSHLLLGYGLLAEGSDLADPAAFNQLVAKLMIRGL